MDPMFTLSEGTRTSVGPRLGTFMKTLATPAALLDTRCGQLTRLTPELGKLVGVHGAAVRFGDIYSQAKSVAQLETTLRSYLHLGDKPVIVTQRSPAYFPVAQNFDKGHSFETYCGRRVVSPADYATALGQMQPCLGTALADEVPFTLGLKRHRKAISRSLEWLDLCLSRSAGTPLLATVLGGCHPSLRAEAAADAAKRDVAGFWIGGLHLGEGAGERLSLVRTVCGALPADKPRLICTPGDPATVLDLISRGVDVFDSDFPSTLTQFDYAATFAIRPPCPAEATASASASAVAIAASTATLSTEDAGQCGDRTKLNARDRRFETDPRPLLPGCGCYTCTTHSRAYVLHLLNVHEMLGPALLQLHNVHHYLAFFQEVRAAVGEGRFEAYREWFLGANGLDAVTEVEPVAARATGAAPSKDDNDDE